MNDWIGWTTTSKSFNNSKENGAIPNRHGSAVIEFPNDLEIVITREFDAPITPVFGVLTKPEHLRKTFAGRMRKPSRPWICRKLTA